MTSTAQVRVRRALFSFAVLWFLAAPMTKAEVRTWTHRSGEYTVQATFITFQFDKVWLLRDDGRTFGIGLEELSEKDGQFVARLLAKNAAAPPPKTSNPPGRVPYDPGREVARLENSAIRESSGLACSPSRPGLFWTHNDSGAVAEIFAFDGQGRDRGTWRIEDCIAYDWEDMASFRFQGKAYLLLGDVGNNGRSSAVQILHVVAEPEIPDSAFAEARPLHVVRTIHYGYEDDYRDCEAVAIDPTDRTIYLVSKERKGECFVYQIPWPKPDGPDVVNATKIATLKHANVTAMDISPDGLRAVLATYGDAFEYVRESEETWSTAFQRGPRRIALPERIQGESICFGADGQTLYLTSEKRPTPLLEISVLGGG